MRSPPMRGRSLLVDRPADGVVRLRLDRPERRNALDGELVEALLDAVGSLDAPAVVLGSSSPGIFCAGADLALADAARAAISDRLYELCARMGQAPVPFVAALGGPAVGGGAQLALACDLRVAGPQA